MREISMNTDSKHMATSPPTIVDKALKKRPTREEAPADSPDIRVQGQRKGRYAWLLSPLWLCLLVALIIRVWLIIRTHGTLDGDEALLGIQAEHILQGERPIYFYGIPYFGSLEAYVAAFLFSIFGPSVAVLRAETTAFSLMLVALTWWMASLLAKAARLPFSAGRYFTISATLIAAIPPVYDGIVELRTGGGWIESFVIMLLLLVVVFRLTSRWHEGASNWEQAWRWAGIGFVIGFGMWIYPLVTVAIVPSAIWIALDLLIEAIKRVRNAEPLSAALAQLLKKLLLVLAAIPACILGFTPGIIWGASHQWQNITYIFALGGGWSIKRLRTIEQVTHMYGTCVAPRVISGATPMENRLLQAIHSPLLILGVLCIFTTLALVAASFRWHHPVLLQARRLAAFPALVGICSATLFCLSKTSASILIGCDNDLGGRYAAPLVLVLPFFFATVFTLVGMFIYEKSQRPEARGTDAVSATEVRPANGIAHRRLSVLMLGGLLAILVAYLGAQTVTYGLTNQNRAFQSPWCVIAPADYTPIISYMEQEHIQYAWATNLLGYQISFITNNQIIFADPLPRIHPAIAINRIPAYTDTLARADRPSLLVFVKHGDIHPHLLQLLDAEQITYKAAFFPSQPGIDVMVVTPLNRTVPIFESPGFDIFYCGAR